MDKLMIIQETFAELPKKQGDEIYVEDIGLAMFNDEEFEVESIPYFKLWRIKKL